MKEKIGGPRQLTGWSGLLKRCNSNVLHLTATLRQVNVFVSSIECRACGRSDELERKVLVRKHGSGMTFARLRRMAAMGCDRLIEADGDQCQTRFPCSERVDEEQPLAFSRRDTSLPARK